MSRFGPGARTVVAILIAVLLVGGGRVLGPVADARAAETPDRSNVILVLDFSASILRDEANRNRFGAALERIAARVDETSADLIAGDARLSIVQFATSAADLPGCVDLKTPQQRRDGRALRRLPPVRRDRVPQGRGRPPRRSASTRTTWRRWSRPTRICRGPPPGRRSSCSPTASTTSTAFR